MLCSDGFTISFQPPLDENDGLLHHHVHSPGPDRYGSPIAGGKLPKPVEFRRRVLMKALPRVAILPEVAEHTSPMTKLLMEQEKLLEPRMVPWVEVYPLKLNYNVVDDHSSNSSVSMGHVLVSRRTRVFDAMQSLMKAAAPRTVSSCRRVWTRCTNRGTQNPGDGYEVVDLNGLDGKLLKRDQDGELPKPQLLVGEWSRIQGEVETMKELDVLIEIRRSNEKWPRMELELSNRLQVGDFVDAQDSAGKWYEALVRRVEDDVVTVHYFGWASKWDSTIRRHEHSKIESASAVSRLQFVTATMFLGMMKSDL